MHLQPERKKPEILTGEMERKAVLYLGWKIKVD